MPVRDIISWNNWWMADWCIVLDLIRSFERLLRHGVHARSLVCAYYWNTNYKID
ncbi:unnamed protein product [Urochloa humidicola]